MGVKIYKDSNLKNEVDDGVLIEGVEYILDLSDFTPDLREYWVNEHRINDYTTFLPKNQFATIKFVNVVGYVNLFGKIFDVRSSKLSMGKNSSGNEQFKSLLEDLVNISSKMNFSYSGVASAKRITEIGNFNTNDVEQFDYFFQLTFDFPTGYNLDSLLAQVLNQPNNTTISYTEKTPIYRSKRLTPNFLKQLFHSESFGLISENHSLSQTPLALNLKSKSGKNYMPSYVVNLKKTDSFDTVENRFVKFLLEEINSICLRLAVWVNDKILKNRIDTLKVKVSHYLRQPFFKEIGRLNYLPDSSSVLLNKAGYRELYYHFIQSKLGFSSLLEELKKCSMKSGLKDIATLYEIWVFFKIGYTMFKEDLIKQVFANRILEKGEIIREVIWSNQTIELSYNFPYTRQRKTSYSVMLKPDISLKINDNLFLFDAKYKNITKIKDGESEELQKLFKPEDIHKMHAYLDAIIDAKCSVAIYPGTEFIFYNKYNFSVSKNTNNLTFEGVGAIPLVPLEENETFRLFFRELRNSYTLAVATP